LEYYEKEVGEINPIKIYDIAVIKENVMDNAKIALLIDSENISPKYLPSILQELG
jgi:hypothetical protein